jgi:hypothetical protein
VGPSRSGHARQLRVARMGCPRAVMGGARPIGPQRPARRDSVVGHAENRRARSSPGAIMVRTLGAIGSAPAAAPAGARFRASTAGRGPGCFPVMVAASRISRFADLPRAAGRRPTRAGNGGSPTATATVGATSSPSAMGTARRSCSTTTSTPAAAATGAGSRAERR